MKHNSCFFSQFKLIQFQISVTVYERHFKFNENSNSALSVPFLIFIIKIFYS